MVTMEFDMCRANRDFVDYGWIEPINLAERNAYIKECRLFLFSKLGAFVIDGCLKYWRVFSFIFSSTQRYLRAFLSRRLAKGRGIHSELSLKSGRWY